MRTSWVKNKYLGLIPGIGMFSMGIFITAFWLRGLAVNSLLSPQWPAAAGTVISSGITSKTTSKSSLNNPSWKTYTTDYYPSVSYSYTVNGRLLTGDTIYFGCCASDGTENSANRVALFYPAASPVKVFYNPANPSVAVLQPGWHNELLAYTAAVLCGLLGGMWAIAASLYHIFAG